MITISNNLLIIANKKHDVVVWQLYDRRERKYCLPVGLMYLTDAETGESVWVDTSTRKSGTSSKRMVSNEIKELDRIFKHAGVDMASISADEDYVRSLITLFKKRGAGY